MVDPFAEISFLTRSRNRVTVLRTLAAEGYGESELVDETGISAVTVGRILEDFTERGWIHRVDGGYRTTEVGNLLAADYERFHRTMNLACRLGPGLDVLPVSDFGFDLRELAEAEIIDPNDVSQLRTLDRWRELIRQADEVVGLEPASNAAVVLAEPVHEAVTRHGLELRAVLSHAYVERANQSRELQRLLRELIDAGAKLHRAPDTADIPYAMATIDETAAISAFDDAGSLRTGIVSDSDQVYGWIRDTYQTHRDNSTRLTAEAFGG